MDDSMPINKIIDKLIQISKNKHRYVSITLGIQKNLSMYIEQGRTENIAKQIELKDKYLSRVQKMDMDFYALFSELKLSLGVDSIDKINGKKYPQLKELKKIVGEIIKLNEEIDIIDSQNTKILTKDMGETSNKLRGIKQGRRAANAYKAQKNIVKSLSQHRKKSQ
jgi:hypothetical protein